MCSKRLEGSGGEDDAERASNECVVTKDKESTSKVAMGLMSVKGMRAFDKNYSPLLSPLLCGASQPVEIACGAREDRGADSSSFTSSSLPGDRSGAFSYIPQKQFSTLSTSWTSKGSVEILSPYVRRWRRHCDESSSALRPWDFSEVWLAVNNTATKLSQGMVRAELPSRSGVSGTYMLRSMDSDVDIFGVFKPIDEEAHLDSEPERLEDEEQTQNLLQFIRHAFHKGEGAYKEAAAYLLDHDRFADVPQTAIARCEIPTVNCPHSPTKIGAFQVFKQNIGDADDFGPGVFAIEDVQRIAILDIRVLNCDRHPGNILVCLPRVHRTCEYSLTPIDHGFILPDRVVASPWPAWMNWPQAKQPLSPATRRYVLGLDGESDAKVLQEELNGHLRSGSILTLRICTDLLRIGVEENLTLFEIGKLMFTRNSCEPTFLEKVTCEALSVGVARQRRLDNLAEKELDDLSPTSVFELDSVSPREDELSPETEEFVLRYVRRMIGEELRVRDSNCTGMGRTRSNPNFMRNAHSTRVSSPPVDAKLSTYCALTSPLRSQIITRLRQTHRAADATDGAKAERAQDG